MIETKSERELAYDGSDIDVEAFSNLKFTTKGPNLPNNEAQMSPKVVNITFCVKGGFVQVCIIESAVTAYKTAVVKHGDKVFTLSVTFRYNESDPVVYDLSTPEITPENKHAMRRRLQTQFYANIGRLIVESQDLSGYHFSAKHVINRPYNVSLKKINAIGKDVVAEIMNVLGGDYITISMT